MAERFKSMPQLFGQFLSHNGHKLAVVEGNRQCNRRCDYCKVPQQYNPDKELTLPETLQNIDWLYDQGYRSLTYLGGEPLAHFKTKEGTSCAERTYNVINYATSKGIFTNLTTNGDYLTTDVVRTLKQVGLDSISLSLHTYSHNSLNHLIEGGRMAAEAGIIPIITTVLTAYQACHVPGIAAEVAYHGIIFGTGLVQTKGQCASTANNELIPSPQQQQEVFRALLRLKTFGFVRNNRKYLQHAPDYFPNRWTCNPQSDTVIYIGAEGTINLCSDIHTDLKMAEIASLKDPLWRNLKAVKIKECGGCLYHCYYETENPDLLGDIPFIVVGLLIRTDNARLAEKWGKYAVERCRQIEKETNWDLNLAY